VGSSEDPVFAIKAMLDRLSGANGYLAKVRARKKRFLSFTPIF
jgi:hypothetical protein